MVGAGKHQIKDVIISINNGWQREETLNKWTLFWPVVGLSSVRKQLSSLSTWWWWRCVSSTLTASDTISITLTADTSKTVIKDHDDASLSCQITHSERKSPNVLKLSLNGVSWYYWTESMSVRPGGQRRAGATQRALFLGAGWWVRTLLRHLKGGSRVNDCLLHF